MNPEQRLLSAVIRTKEYQALAGMGITSNLFFSYREEMQFLERYIASHNRTPSRSVFKDKFPEFKITKTDDVEHWCSEVRRHHARTQLVKLMETTIEKIDDDNIDEAISTMQAGVMNIQTEVAGSSPAFSVFDDWEETYEVVEERYERSSEDGISGVPTGFPSFDALSGGYQPGWLVLVAARLGVGKTWYTVRSSVEAATLGKTVSYFSLEQTRNQIAMRVHSFTSKRYKKKLIFNARDLGRGTGFDLGKYKEFLEGLSSQVPGKMLIHDKSRGPVGIQQVRAAIEKDQPDIVFIDYITKMDMPHTRGDAWQAIGRLSGELQDLAQIYNVPIVCGAQINRAGVNDPTSDTLAGADKLGQDTDVLVTLKPRSEHLLRLTIQKNRHGPHGVKWFAQFDPGQGIFDEVSSSKAATIEDRDKDID